jgi:hypothetical protein
MLKYLNAQFATKVIAISDDSIRLVQQFVDTVRATQARVDSGDKVGAANGYKDLLSIYNNIVASNLDPLHKEVAYDQLVKVYNALRAPPVSSVHATTHIIAAAILLVLFSFLVFFKPTVFGLATAEPRIVQDVNWAFTDSGARDLHLEAVPRSLAISGKVDGDGMVRVYAVTPESRALVFDNDLVSVNDDGTFSSACVNTCYTGLDTPDVTLDVVVQNAALTIYSVEYRK